MPRLEGRRAIARSAIPVMTGLVGAGIVLAVVWHLDRAATATYVGQVRAGAVRDLAAVRAATEIAINRRLHLTTSLKAYVSVNPDVTSKEFAQLAAIIMREAAGIRSVTSIKDNVINDVYPREGNEGAIGLELLKHPQQRAAVKHAIETGMPWLAGPVQLVQGGEAFIHRAPVYTIDRASAGEVARPDEFGGASEPRAYWGMVSLLIDKQTLVDELTMASPKNFKIMIRPRDASGRFGEPFVGDPAIFDDSPLETTISLPTGAWQLCGVPAGGWPSAVPWSSSPRTAGAVFAMLFGLLTHMAVNSMARYREYARRLECANAEAELARRAAEDVSRQLADEAQAIQKHATQLEEAQSASLNMMEDIEAARHKLSASNHALARSNQELEQFAYVASHDLQEPLRKVSSFCGLLESEYGDAIPEQAAEYMHYIVDGATRMRKLIQDLLVFSRIESQGRDFGDVRVGDALAAALYNLEGAIEAAHAVVTHDEMPVVCADKRQLTQLFQNLIGNGIKYHGDDPPHIHVGVRAANDVWTFSVSDNGIGIAPHYHEQVFGIFKRLHARADYSGTGIGLAICKRIVDRLGGRIWIDSDEGCGATLLFTIPKTPDATRTSRDDGHVAFAASSA